jgi:hypothetical protein
VGVSPFANHKPTSGRASLDRTAWGPHIAAREVGLQFVFK